VVELDVVFLGKDVNRATGLRKQIQINFQRHFFKGPEQYTEAQPSPKLQKMTELLHKNVLPTRL